MNLKEVYEIFYPGNCGPLISVWDEKPKYRSKKDFFEELVPMEIRWLNSKIWNDKSRRSRFLSDSNKESKYIVALRSYLLEHPWTIPRMERKANDLLCGKISEQAMNDIFLQIVQRETIEFSGSLWEYLIDTKTERLRQNWGNVLTFYFFLSIFPKEINQIYAQYLYGLKHRSRITEEEEENTVVKKDRALFQYEYPPDMSIVSPGERVIHTWVIKNVGDTPWENRYYECNQSPMVLDEENRIIRIPEFVYPGDMVTPSVSFLAPNEPGTYVMNWKMKDSNGNLVYLDKLGLGLHFTVMEEEENKPIEEEEIGNYKILEEIPPIPATVVAGKLYSHIWIIQNTGETIWREYYLECINMGGFQYVKSELRVPLKERVVPGEKTSIKIEFATPPIEGVYCMVWRIMKKDGTPAFSKERKLEVLLNLI